MEKGATLKIAYETFPNVPQINAKDLNLKIKAIALGLPVYYNEKKEIVIKVSDTGVGISAEDMPKLFSEGGRGKESIKVKSKIKTEKKTKGK
jgi:signal transduction histidine kinase